MKAETLKRLFKALSIGSDHGVEEICRVIIRDEKEKNHLKLAKQLEQIMKERITNDSFQSALKNKTSMNLSQMPMTVRNSLKSLLTIIPRDQLEHDMVLPPIVEARFERIEREFAARERLAKHGLRPITKVLIYGDPGCGKTLGAKRLAWNTGLDLVKVQFDAVISSRFGESANNLRMIFDYCSQKPSLLLLDECDFIARSRTSSQDIGEVQRIVNTLLKLLEDIETPGLIVATTNIYNKLDNAIFRRFDESFEVPKPGKNEVKQLLTSTLSNTKVDQKINLNLVIDKVAGLSAADIVKISRNVAKAAVLTGENVVSKRLLDACISDFNRLERNEG